MRYQSWHVLKLGYLAVKEVRPSMTLEGKRSEETQFATGMVWLLASYSYLDSLPFLVFWGKIFQFCFVLGFLGFGFFGVFLVDKKSRCHCHFQAKPLLELRETIVKGHFLYQGETS